MALNADINTQRQAFQNLRDKVAAAKAALDELPQHLDGLDRHVNRPLYLPAEVARREALANGFYDRVAALDAALDAFLGE